jgi:hypothetical protein
MRGRFNPKAFRRGQTIWVYYDPRDPKSAVLRRRDWPGGGTVTILSGVFAGIGLALLWL